MKRRTFTLLAFLAASVLPAAGLAILHAGSQGAAPHVTALFPAYYQFSAAVTVLIGLPAYFVLEQFALVRWWTASVCGGLAGGAVISTIAWLFSDLSLRDPAMFGLFGSFGAAAGLLFWVIWRLGQA